MVISSYFKDVYRLFNCSWWLEFKTHIGWPTCGHVPVRNVLNIYIMHDESFHHVYPQLDERLKDKSKEGSNVKPCKFFEFALTRPVLFLWLPFHLDEIFNPHKIPMSRRCNANLEERSTVRREKEYLHVGSKGIQGRVYRHCLYWCELYTILDTSIMR